MTAHESPEFKSNIIRVVFYCWITGFAIKLYKECFSAEDLYPIDEELSSDLVTRKLENDWSKEQKQNPNSSFFLARCLWTSFGRVLVWAALCLLCSEACSQLIPIVIKYYLLAVEERSEDAELFSINRENLTGYGACLLLVLLPALRAIMSNICMKITMFAAIQCRTAMSGMIYERVLALRGESKSSYSVGKCVSLVSSDTLRVENFFNFIHLLWQTPLQIVCSIFMLYMLLGWPAFPGVSMLLLGLPIQLLAIRLLYVYRKKIADFTDKRIRLFQEMLIGARVIKLNSWEDVFIKKLSILRIDEMNCVRRFHLASGVSVVVTLVFPAMCSVVGYGTYSLMGNAMKSNIVFAAIVYFNMLETPLLSIPVAINAAVSAKGAILRLDKFLRLSNLREYFISRDGMNDSSLEKDAVIEFRNASFEWENCSSSPSSSIPLSTLQEKGKISSSQSPPLISTPTRLHDVDYYSILSNITLTIPQGSLVAIVGPVGCGKSSLLHAIMGEMKQSSGILKIKRGVKFSYCPQSAWILNDTVRENICFGSPFDEERYWKVINQCALDTDLDAFPSGDLTEIGERGIGLSGGQKARVNLARAAYSNADIVLIDDPMSAVDARVRNILFNKCILDGVMRNATRLLVTHNLSVLPYVDHVIVIKEGAILQQGTYDHLIQSSQYFNDLMTKYYGEEEIIDETLSSAALQSDIIGGKQVDLTEFEENLVSSSSATVNSSTLDIKKDSRYHSASAKTPHRPKLAKASFKAYMRYVILAGGAVFISFACIANIIHEAARCYKDIWLNDWTEKSYPSITDFVYLSVYGGIGLSLIITTWTCVLTFIIGGYFASKRIHEMAVTKIFRASIRFFDTTPVGRILNRFSRDMDVIDNQVAEEIYNFLYAIVQAMSAPMIVIWGSWKAGFALVPPLLLSIVLQLIYRRCNHQTQALQVKALANLMCHFSESYLGISVIKIFKKEDEFIGKYHNLTNLYNRAVYITMILRRWTGLRSEFLGGFIVGAFAFISLLLRVNSSTIGVVLSLLLVFAGSLDWFVKQFADTEMSMLSVDRLCQYAFDLSPEIYNPPNPIELPSGKNGQKWPIDGKIRFENYTAGYITGVEPILRQMTIEINSGEKVAIIGRTGAGKSTILAAIFRFIEATTGKIEIDGCDISRIPLTKLRSSLTVVPQDPVLFSGTIRFNLDPTNIFTDADIWNVIDRLNMRNFIEEMEDNGSLDSEIADYGQNISLGEKQMLCVARAILHKSKLVIMDEPTASVDLETDEKIHECLWSNFSDSTVMTITHRLTHIEKYDRVLVLDHGRVVEFDTPQKLMDNPDSYLSGLLNESQNVQNEATNLSLRY